MSGDLTTGYASFATTDDFGAGTAATAPAANRTTPVAIARPVVIGGRPFHHR